MEKALGMVTEKRSRVSLECVETGEVATMTEWAKELASQRGIQQTALYNKLSAASKRDEVVCGLHFVRVTT